MMLLAAACTEGGTGGSAEEVDLQESPAADTGDSGGQAEDVSSDAEAGGDDAGTVVFYHAAPNESLDPAMGSNDNTNAQATLMNVYDRLIDIDASGEMMPGLATEWEFVDEELTTLRLTLREGVTFHDGTPFDAEAVVANFDRAKEVVAESGRTYSEPIEAIESYEATGTHEVTITLAEPNGGFPFGLASQAGMMISPAALEGATGIAEFEPIGAGPYRVDEFQASEFTRMTAFEDYWDGAEGRAEVQEHHYVPESQTRLNALRSGEANVAMIDPNQVQDAEAAGLEVQVNQGLATWTMYPNNSGPLGDVAVRRALSKAIDREAISEGLSFGTGQPTCQPFPPDYVAYVEDPECEYDPEEARQILADAGYADGVEIDFVLLNTPEYQALIEVVQQYLLEVGITMDITTIDVAQYTRFTDGEIGDLMAGRWGGRPDPLTTLTILTGPGAQYTPGGTVGEECEALLEEASRYEVSDPERMDAIRAANEHCIVEMRGNFNIMTRANIYAYKPECIGNLNAYVAAGSDDWRQVTIAEGC